MIATLEDFLLISQKSKADLANETGKTERSVRNWLKDSSCRVHFDGRSFRINSITAKRLVYRRKP